MVFDMPIPSTRAARARPARPGLSCFVRAVALAAALAAGLTVPAPAALASSPAAAPAAAPADPAMARIMAAVTQGDVVLPHFRFGDGSELPQLRLHYRTLGTPHRDAAGQIDNAVMILHGTGGSGAQFLRPSFAGVLFVPGGLLDTAKTYIILPDGIGHGGSSKPSDGLHARFPAYDYDDMVRAQHALLGRLGVTSLRLLLGTSMGCMHSFVWGETYPGFARRLMPLACLTVEIAGRNRLWRKMGIDAIRNDPAWQGGEYKTEPQAALRNVSDLLTIASSAPLAMQQALPTRDAADHFLDTLTARDLAELDANDLLYALSASRHYNPSPSLARITVPVMWVNSADDFINPPELGIAEREVRRMPKARFVVIPASAKTHGHGTHTWPVFWQGYLASLLAQ